MAPTIRFRETDRARTYNGVLLQLTALTDALASIADRHGASVPDVATAWALHKGVTSIIGVTRPQHIGGLVSAGRITLSDAEANVLEALAEATGVNTRGWWEQAL